MWYEPKEKTLHSGSGTTGNGQIFDLEGKYGALRLQVTGITSATITFEQCNDGGTTWDGIAGVNTETGAKVTTTTADGTFLFPVTGIKKYRARISAYATGTIYAYAMAVAADVAPMEVYASLLAGTQIAGKVGIDQTTDGTTNKVHAHSSAADDFLANANIQVGDADVAVGNPVPVAGTAAHDAAATGNPVQVGGVYRATDPATTDGDAASLRVNAKGEVIIALTGKASSATFTRPNDAIAYTAGDVVSTLAGAVMEFATVGAANDLITILGSRLTCAVNAVPAGCTGFYLHLYNAAPTAIADNAVYNLPAGDLAKHLGYIVIGQPVDLGDNIAAINDNINHTVKLASTSLFGILQTIGAFTPTANAVKAVTLNVAGL